MDPSELECQLRSVADGQLLLARIDACRRSGFFDDDFLQGLLEQVACNADPNDDASILLRKTKDRLTQTAGDEVAGRLRQEFVRAADAPFDAVRIVTLDTFIVNYTPHPTEDGGSSSAREVLYREQDMPGCTSTNNDGLLMDSDIELLPIITLCSTGRKAYVASKSDWEARMAGQDNPADASADWPGFAATADTELVALVVRRDANLGWSTCHRPTLFDAVEHTWWWCWHDDPLHHGHTVVISSLGSGRLERGAREWVVGPSEIETSSGVVTRRHLGKVTKSTIRETQSDAWSNFLQLTAGAGDERRSAG